ncbi:hypothetical protein VTG60DRAFT_6085 [Thermothelomyces hinnuleus]
MFDSFFLFRSLSCRRLFFPLSFVSRGFGMRSPAAIASPTGTAPVSVMTSRSLRLERVVPHRHLRTAGTTKVAVLRSFLPAPAGHLQGRSSTSCKDSNVTTSRHNILSQIT